MIGELLTVVTRIGTASPSAPKSVTLSVVSARPVVGAPATASQPASTKAAHPTGLPLWHCGKVMRYRCRMNREQQLCQPLGSHALKSRWFTRLPWLWPGCNAPITGEEIHESRASDAP